MLTDTHCHLYLEQFAGDVEAVIQRAAEAGIEKMLVPGMDLETSYEAVRLAETHSNVFAAVGFHPTETGKITPQTFERLHELAFHPRVVAIGEIGLDYYWVKNNQERSLQAYNLTPHLNLAIEVNKPLILHLREENDAEEGDASNHLLDILDDWYGQLTESTHPLSMNPGVFHSFNGNLTTAKRAIFMNFVIGVTGPITYKKNDTQRELVGQLPLDRILIETDAPFQTPLPHRGKRNEPSYVGLVADKIAEVHQTTREAIAEVTTANANRLFGWEANA